MPADTDLDLDDAADGDGRDEQDQSETFDEDNQTAALSGADRAEMRTFEELPQVHDFTTAQGDADDDDAVIGEDMDDADYDDLDVGEETEEDDD